MTVPEEDTQATAAAHAFVSRWQNTMASELATAQSFVRELCDLLGVESPHATAQQHYMFERPVTFQHGDGHSSAGRIDCYRRGAFVLEAKKLRAGVQTKGFDDAMLRARAQAEGYARALPAEEGRPPFLLVVDVGNVIEIFSEFTRSGATYTPFPDPRSHRIVLADLVRTDVRQKLRTIWTDPDSLNPALASARVTRQVSAQLALLANSLETVGYKPDHVAAFLTRSLFSMFAEDVELLPKGSFLGLLEKHHGDPPTLANMLRVLWADMDRGGFSAALAGPVLRFNGKLFKESTADGYALLLNEAQIALLIAAAKSNWRDVEPAIFGTLLERALSTTERHALGAHYTPRAYVERLVLPAVMEPLRTDWVNVQAAALVLAHDGKLEEARAEVRKFHHQLCTLRVLDPACGSGNFLYVTLEHLKRLEGEVLNQLDALGETQNQLGMEGETVTLQQLRGIELNERAAALAELVLWIGFLQWHIRTRGNKAVAEPVVHDYGNIEHRDAVLECDEQELAYSADGQLLTRWDGVSYKTHLTTGALVPDESAQVPQWKYIRPRQAPWPQADFIVGNPPFIGAGPMRAALGDGYVQALRQAWSNVTESADFVMYWWSRAASLVVSGHVRRFGFITTNSLRQTFNRRIVQAAMDDGAGLVFAIPDHPWVDSANGAAVRIAMTVVGRKQDFNVYEIPDLYNADINVYGANGRLMRVTAERPGEHGEVDVTLTERWGEIHADLTIGANVAEAQPLKANEGMSSPGVKLHGAGFIVTGAEVQALGLGTVPGLDRYVRDYRNGRDLTATARAVKVIDLFGLSSEQVRTQFPAVYQRVLERVKPERDQNNRATYRENWWIFGEPRRELRPALLGLTRFIATVETAKHRVFQFLDASILPDNMLIAIASDEAFTLGVLSSSVHVAWALATGGRLGYGNDARYNKSRCFETFPFPSANTGLTPELRAKIAATVEQIDEHRKRQQMLHPALTLTGVYNVVESLRAGRVLTAKEKVIHEQGLVGVLKELHDELDSAVLAAYGLTDVPQSEWLQRLVDLNATRVKEEERGIIRWLRPAFQNPQAVAGAQDKVHASLGTQSEITMRSGETAITEAGPMSWPSSLPEQVRAVASVLALRPGAVSVADIEARFKGRGPWKRSLPRILETLEALGRARREGEFWRS
jgi:hypothetical protein